MKETFERALGKSVEAVKGVPHAHGENITIALGDGKPSEVPVTARTINIFHPKKGLDQPTKINFAGRDYWGNGEIPHVALEEAMNNFLVGEESPLLTKKIRDGLRDASKVYHLESA